MRPAPHGIDPGAFRLLLDACRRQSANERALDLAKMDQYRAESRDLMKRYGAEIDPEDTEDDNDDSHDGALA